MLKLRFRVERSDVLVGERADICEVQKKLVLGYIEFCTLRKFALLALRELEISRWPLCGLVDHHFSQVGIVFIKVDKGRVV